MNPTKTNKIKFFAKMSKFYEFSGLFQKENVPKQTIFKWLFKSVNM